MVFPTSQAASPTKRWDVFISHASEDKQSVVDPLADRLQRAGLKVWLDRQELKLGDSLREKIDQGLAESRFGLLIVSPRFLLKYWPRQELNGLMALEEDGQKVILPVWHEVSKEQLKSYSPLLADRFAANTSDGLDQVVQLIVAVVMSPDSGSPSCERPTVVRRLLDLLDGNSEPRVIADFVAYQASMIQRFGKAAAMVTLNGYCVPLIETFEGNSGTFVTFTAFGALSGTLRRSDGALADDIEAILSELTAAFAWCFSNTDAASRAFTARLNYESPLISGMFWSRYWLICRVRVISRRRRDLSASDQQFLDGHNHGSRAISAGPARARTCRPIVETYESLVEELDLAERRHVSGPITLT